MSQNDPRCKRPPKGTSKADLLARHKAKMMGKHFRNLDPSYRRRGIFQAGKGVI